MHEAFKTTRVASTLTGTKDDLYQSRTVLDNEAFSPGLKNKSI